MNAVYSSRGQIVSGSPKPRRVELLATCKRFAEKEGYPLPVMVWEVVKALYKEAQAGNLLAIKMFLQHFTDAETAPDVQVSVDARTINLSGPPLPPPDKLAEHFADIAVELKESPFRLTVSEPARDAVEELLG